MSIPTEMNVNPDPAKQAHEIIFSCKVQIFNHHLLIFNQNTAD